jgi:uncharacterized damage-inducible protein DinB/predicted RNase H-like HicB family nuclease
MDSPATEQPASPLHVYLERADGGPCMAHVPSLPGCYVRAQTREEALAGLPAAVQAYYAWLRRYGEPVPAEDAEVELEVAGEATGTGPFDPGDAAALFPPDREPVSPEEMEHHFRLMAHSRADLLALVADLQDEILDWQPGPMPVSIRRVLRHVGNAEQWYVSRLVPPETLPAEWKGVGEMPILVFLEMERRTAIERLRKLTPADRTEVRYPERWTRHPDEAWTARKALRRFLEHEREHTGQIREILSTYRQGLLARLAYERTSLLAQLLGLDAAALTERPISEHWTVKDLLAHVAAWDRWQERTTRTMVAGKDPDFSALEDFDASNERFIAGWRERSLEAVLAEVGAARASYVAWLEALPVEEFFRTRTYAGHDWTFASVPLQVQWQHDVEHTSQIAAWRRAEKPGGRSGPLPVLRAVLDAGREELLAAARLVPPEQRASYPVCGHWTAHDVIGHLADWEWPGAEGLRDMAEGRPPSVEPIRDIDLWNAEHVEVRRGQPWSNVWEDLHAARRAFLAAVDALDPAELGRVHAFPWGGYGTAYDWVSVYIAHDREHAEHLRVA